MQSLLIVSIAYSPNIGGVETHLSDLVSALVRRNYKVVVLTYQPVTSKLRAKYIERLPGLTVIRLPFISGLFYKLVKFPILEFIYLVPLLFFAMPLILIAYPGIKTIHSHGLVAGFVSVVWGRLFGRRVITTTHSVYNFPIKGPYTFLAKLIFGLSNKVLCLSAKSVGEIKKLGVSQTQVSQFTYWVDLNRFSPQSKKASPFTVLFVGRLVPEKGVFELLQAAKMWKKGIKLVIAGNGPLENEIPVSMYLGGLTQEQLPHYYSLASLVIVPSIHEEGFGRVILEALACGTVVLGSNRGAIPEAMDQTVGEVFNVTPENIVKIVNHYYEHPTVLNRMSQAARKFALERYSDKNAQTIIKAYDQ